MSLLSPVPGRASRRQSNPCAPTSTRSVPLRALAGGIAVGCAGAVAAVAMPAQAATRSHAPVGAIELIKGGNNGIHLDGWAADADTSRASKVRVALDGRQIATITADKAHAARIARYPHVTGKHGFAGIVPATGGRHTVCLSVVDIAPAHARVTAPTALGCRTLTVLVDPVGIVEVKARAVRDTRIVVSGWAIDPETFTPTYVGISVDGRTPVRARASLNRPGLSAGFPGIGPHHGYSAAIAVSAPAHRICATAYNQRQGKNTKLGCISIPAIPATVPGVPRTVTATAQVNAAQVSWTGPANTGGVPVAGYQVTSVPASTTVTVTGSKLAATVSGLHAGSSYRFVVAAVNALGQSRPSSATAAVTVKAAVVAQTGGPPLISTSRYLRNLHASDPAGNRRKTFAMGATDATYNPADHAYLILLQFGGQSSTGNTQSATANSSLTYAQTVAAMRGYFDGYHSKQKAHAPVTIAIGTNNDRDVRATTGTLWAQRVVNPLAEYASQYSSISVAGANDIEPGFLGSMSQSQAWVKGFLAATKAKFVFNGSADGCGWTQARARCNNGYTAAGVHLMAGGYAPTRILALPQIYNYTQPKQWKYISLTGAVTGLKKVNFAGPLTEVTACQQARSCSSLTNNSAWTALWNALRSDARVKPASLPYGTDLRIN